MQHTQGQSYGFYIYSKHKIDKGKKSHFFNSKNEISHKIKVNQTTFYHCNILYTKEKLSFIT